MRTDHGFDIRDVGARGRGLFATREYDAGDFLIEYVGKKIPTSVADTMTTKRYLFEIDTDWTIDGETEANTARYINHSCDPNAEAEIAGDRIEIRALRPIEAGEEITIDYGDEYFNEFIRPNGCLCGSDVCRQPRFS